jgi:hypothetical protein
VCVLAFFLQGQTVLMASSVRCWSGVIDDSRPTAGYQACESNKHKHKIFFQAQHFRIVKIKEQQGKISAKN